MDQHMGPMIVNLAPTGMVPQKAQNPHVPISASEIADTVLECAEIGISMAHLHARDASGKPVSDPEAFAPFLSNIRADEKGKNLILCVTTSGRKVSDFEGRAAVLDLDGDIKPDMASLTLGSLNFMHQASMNAPDMVRQLLARMNERGIKPELEVFDLGMINFAKVLIKEGLLKPPYYFNILVGNVASAQANLAHISMMIGDLPEGSVWSLAGFGRFQREANGIAASTGGGVRVGLEDNLWLHEEPTRVPARNADLVQRVHSMAQALGRPVATAAQVRDRLKLER